MHRESQVQESADAGALIYGMFSSPQHSTSPQASLSDGRLAEDRKLS